MAEHGFLPDFPAEVRREVEALEAREPAGIRDLRDRVWSSIDNRESRDLDQIEVAERLGYDHIRVFVAVADVDGLVDKDSATDSHAGHSTTSVYAGPFVFPMLPERLCTDLTSLNPGQDRSAVVIEMDVGPAGAVARHDVYRALVRSRAKLSYDAVGAWLEGGTDVPPEVAAVEGLEEQLRLQDEAAQRLRALRRRHGLLDLETIEARPVVAGGRVIDLEVPAQDRARDIIESLMIAANVAMARFLKSRRVASLRRVVRTPKRWDRIVAVAAEQAREPARISGEEGLIEPHQMAILAQLLQGPRPQHRIAGQRVSRRGAHDGEGHQGDAEERRHHRQQAHGQPALHGRASQTS